MKYISLTLNDIEFHKLMEILKSFDSVADFSSENVENDLAQWQKDELDKRLEAHFNGTEEYENWEDVSASLIKKYRVN